MTWTFGAGGVSAVHLVPGPWALGEGWVGNVGVSYESRPEVVLRAHTRGLKRGGRCETYQSYDIERLRFQLGIFHDMKYSWARAS